MGKLLFTYMSRGRICGHLIWLVLCLHSITAAHLPKRGVIDREKCESFCLSSGFQGSFGNCNCGYIMFGKRKRSDPGFNYLDNRFQEEERLMKSDEYRDPILAELSDDELLDALELLDKIKNNQHHARELSDRELALFLWLVSSVETTRK